MNEDITALATQIAQLAKRVHNIESQMHGMASANEGFKALGAHAATCEPNAVKSEMQLLKADMLDLAKKIESMRDALATGSAMQHKTTFAKEDYASILVPRLQNASLAEVIEMQEGK